MSDANLSPEQLDDKYNPDGDGEHPEWTRKAWIQEVMFENVLSGYWQWVADQIRESNEDET